MPQQQQQQQSVYGSPTTAAASQQQAPPPPQQQKRESLPYARGQPLRIDTPQVRPLQSDDDRPTASTLTTSSLLTPDNKLSGLSSSTTYTSGANLFPTPISAAPTSVLSDRPPKEYQRVPPLHDLTRTEPDQDQPYSQMDPQSQPSSQQAPTLPPPPLPSGSQGTTLPNINFLHRSTRASSPPAITATSPSGTSAVQATAQLALSHTQFDRPRRVERDEMLIGRPYYPFDRELVLERQRCNLACWKFNNLTNPTTGVSVVERARMFREILQPREGVQLTATQTTPVTHSGRVGDNTTVETPFNCDYGYNIHLGSNVLISRNCLINDACEVRIGNNVIISPNVCIYTGTCSTDPNRRGGNTGAQQGRPIVIEDDVWIGANAIILDGVRIGQGSTIAAGCVVTRVSLFPCFSRPYLATQR